MHVDRQSASAIMRLHGTGLPGILPPSAEGRGFTRRHFGAMVAGAFGAMAAPRVARAGGGGPYNSQQGICDALWLIKEQACNLAAYVEGLSVPLTDPGDIAYVTNNVLCTATLGQKVLNDPDSLLFTPPDSWLFWVPLDMFGWTLQQTATESCDRACERWEAWCGGSPAGVAEDVWLAQGLYCRIFETAGIT